MKYNGFELKRTPRGAVLDFVMPRELEGKFFVRLYARGPLNDAAEGEPQRVWDVLSQDYGGRPLVAPRQVHGIKIIDASESAALPRRDGADGIFIRSGSRALASLRFADCAPVVIAGGGEPWMAILHSGFKGTLLNISGAALAKLSEKESGAKIWAWIGPRIGACCYCRRKDDPATREALEKFFPESCEERGDFVYFDIGREIRARLAERGLPEENIFDYGGCTRCGRETFYSYRAGDEEKRNFMLAGCSTNRENM